MGSRQHVRLIEILRIYFVPCGSELARDRGVSVDNNAVWNTVIASRLAPTGAVVCQAISGAVA
ncbi:hypothetical protein D3C86_1852610 [compost metagenome]